MSALGGGRGGSCMCGLPCLTPAFYDEETEAQEGNNGLLSVTQGLMAEPRSEAVAQALCLGPILSLPMLPGLQACAELWAKLGTCCSHPQDFMCLKAGQFQCSGEAPQVGCEGRGVWGREARTWVGPWKERCRAPLLQPRACGPFDLGWGGLCPGGPAASEPEGHYLAPHLHCLDHKGWPVVCLPGWGAAGLRRESGSLAPHQASWHPHSGPGAGKAQTRAGWRPKC